MSTDVFFLPITGLPSSLIPYFVFPVPDTNGGDKGFDGVGSSVAVGVESGVDSGGAVFTTDVGLAVGSPEVGAFVDVDDDGESVFPPLSSPKQPASPPNMASVALVRNFLRVDRVVSRDMIV